MASLVKMNTQQVLEVMLQEYERDNQTGIDIKEISKLIYEYTSGYLFLDCSFYYISGVQRS